MVRKWQKRKKITFKYFLNTSHKHETIKNNEKCYPIYAQITFNRKNTTISSGSIIGFNNYYSSEKDFPFYEKQLQKKENIVKNIIRYEFNKIGEDKYTLKGLSERIQYYSFSIATLLKNIFEKEARTFLEDNLSFTNYMSLMKEHGNHWNSGINENEFHDIFFWLFIAKNKYEIDYFKMDSDAMRNWILVYRLSQFDSFLSSTPLVLGNYDPVIHKVSLYNWLINKESPKLFNNFLSKKIYLEPNLSLTFDNYFHDVADNYLSLDIESNYILDTITNIIKSVDDISEYDMSRDEKLNIPF